MSQTLHKPHGRRRGLIVSDNAVELVELGWVPVAKALRATVNPHQHRCGTPSLCHSHPICKCPGLGLTAHSRCRGSTFLMTLWLLAALTALAVTLAYGARVERHHAANVAAVAEARQAQQAGLRYVVKALTDTGGTLPTDQDMPAAAMRVGNAAFWIIRPDDEGDGQQHYGLVDEGGRLDINTAPLEVLQRLPESTPEIAAAIIDWRDADETVTDGGAESDFYLRKPVPYNAKNSPFESVEELRLVAGVTDEILWGEDTNRNGMLDAWENDGDTSPPGDDRDGQLNRGLAGWCTAYLRWPAQSTDPAQPLLAINTATRQQIEQGLARYFDPSRAVNLAQAIISQRPLPTIFHLYHNAHLTRQEFELLEPALDFASQGGGAWPLPGASSFRLNLNAAPATVLACLPGLTEAEAQSLLEARLALANGTSLAWALDVIEPEKLLAAMAVLGGGGTGSGAVGRSYQYSADILSVSHDGRAFARARYVIDVSGSTPRVLHRQDLTARGWPLDETWLDRLRAGEPLDDVLADARLDAGL